MPGDLNRVFLIGTLTADPLRAGIGIRLALRTSNTWTSREGEARSKFADHEILVMQPSLVAFTSAMRKGDKIMVEGELDTSGTVVLGGLHSSVQLLVKSRDVEIA